MQKRLNLPLQSIRFFCAVMIYFHHLPFFDYPNMAAIDARLLRYFFSPLTFFFILSGWALASTYYAQALRRTFHIKKYFMKRVLRLYPIHIITFVLSIPMVLALKQWVTVKITLANILLLHAFIPNQSYLFSYNSVSWCLSIFLFLYLLFPFILMLLARFDRFVRGYPLHILLGLVASLGLFLYFAHYDERFPYEYNFSPFERIVDFTVGIFMYLTTTRWEESRKKNKIFSTTLEVIAVGVVAAAHWYAYAVPFKYVRDLYFIIPWSILIGVFSRSDGILSDLLSWRPFVSLGSISLEFFLVSTLSLQWVYLFLAQNVVMDSLQKGVLSFAVIIALSYILHAAVQYPFSRTAFPQTEKGGLKETSPTDVRH